jgi:N-acetyl-gamma-glutamyl-phosphate reductase
VKIPVGIVGITGYSGLELALLALEHPAMDCVAMAGSDSSAGKAVADMHPRLRGLCERKSIAPDPAALAACGVDTAFLCTPNEVSYELAPRLLELGVRVIDLSGSFRLRSAASYPSWYGFEHKEQSLLDSAVYGLTEWTGEKLRGIRLVANPGCYPTSVLLALLPLVRAGLLAPGSEIICDSKSGVTGAGRAARQDLLFGEVTGNFRAYNPVSHRHVPEMCEQLGWDISNFTFVPHLLPVARGILSTIYVSFAEPVTADQVAAEFRRRYRGHPFVRPIGARLPELASVAHTNFCDIGWRVVSGGKRAILFSAIDNLVKGAAGQAVQNFNMMHGLDPLTGLGPGADGANYS